MVRASNFCRTSSAPSRSFSPLSRGARRPFAWFRTWSSDPWHHLYRLEPLLSHCYYYPAYSTGSFRPTYPSRNHAQPPCTLPLQIPTISNVPSACHCVQEGISSRLVANGTISMVVHALPTISISVHTTGSQSTSIRSDFRQVPSILTVWCEASWIEFDCSWLSFHDCMFLNITEGRLLDDYYRPSKPLYDAVKGIRSVARGNHTNPSESYLFSQYHCLQDISSSIVGKGVDMTSPQTYRATYFHLLLILKNSNDPIQNTPSLSEILARCRFNAR